MGGRGGAAVSVWTSKSDWGVRRRACIYSCRQVLVHAPTHTRATRLAATPSQSRQQQQHPGEQGKWHGAQGAGQAGGARACAGMGAGRGCREHVTFAALAYTLVPRLHLHILTKQRAPPRTCRATCCMPPASPHVHTPGAATPPPHAASPPAAAPPAAAPPGVPPCLAAIVTCPSRQHSPASAGS